MLALIAVKTIHFISSAEIIESANQEEIALNIDADSNFPPTYFVGKKLFLNNCAICHALHKNLTGPGLAGITSRVTDKQVLFDWIRNNQKVLKSGDPYFNSLYEAYCKIPMPAFPHLSDEDIQLILDYIEMEQSRYARPQPTITKL